MRNYLLFNSRLCHFSQKSPETNELQGNSNPDWNNACPTLRAFSPLSRSISSFNPIQCLECPSIHCSLQALIISIENLLTSLRKGKSHVRACLLIVGLFSCSDASNLLRSCHNSLQWRNIAEFSFLLWYAGTSYTSWVWLECCHRRYRCNSYHAGFNPWGEKSHLN